MESIASWVELNEVSHLVCDYSPLRISKEWKEQLVSALKRRSINCSVTEVS
jgi:hypothetical protein